MKKQTLLSLLVTSAFLVSPAFAGKSALPEPLDGSKFEGMIGKGKRKMACGTSIAKDNKAVIKNLAELLFCIEDNSGGDIKDKNFVSKTDWGRVTELLEEDYDGVEDVVAKIKALQSKNKGSKEDRQRVRDKSKAKGDEAKAKADLKGAEGKALEKMKTLLKDKAACTKKSGIALIGNAPKKHGKKKLEEMGMIAKGKFKAQKMASNFSSDNAKERKLEQFAYLDAVIKHLKDKPADIAKNQNFLKALADSIKKYWATTAYKDVNKAGFSKIKTFVNDASVIIGASMEFASTKKTSEKDAHDNLQDAQDRKGKAKKEKPSKAKKADADDEDSGGEAKKADADDEDSGGEAKKADADDEDSGGNSDEGASEEKTEEETE